MSRIKGSRWAHSKPMGCAPKKKEVKVEPEKKSGSIVRFLINHIHTQGSITRQEAESLYGVKNFSQHLAYMKKLGYDVTYKKNILAQRMYYFKSKSGEDTKPVEWAEIVKERTEKEIAKVEPEEMRVKTSMKQVILEHLQKHQTITSAVAMKKYKCLNLSAVIQKLKQEGWNISRTITKKNNDYNVASNRNNAYSTYTLEKKVKTKSIYTIHCLHERCMDKLIPVITEEFNTFDEARNYCCGLAENLIADCNTLFGTSLTRFEIVILPETIQVMKKETIKKLFKKTEKSTLLASFCTLPRMVEVL